MIRIVLAIFLAFWTVPGRAEITDLSDVSNFRSVSFIQVLGAKNVHVRLFVPVGEVDATGPEGVAHYLEHLVFASADKAFGPGQRARLANAHTSPYWTIYKHNGPPASLDKMLRSMAAVFQPVDLDPTFMWSERKVVEREYDQRIRGTPFYGFYRRAQRHLYGDHPLGRSVIGTTQSIQQITPGIALDFHRRHYSIHNAHLVISGPLSKTGVAAKVKKYLGGLNGHRPPPRGFRAPLQRGPETGLEMVATGLGRPLALILGHAAAPKDMDRLTLMASVTLLQDLMKSALPGGLRKPLYYDGFVVSQLGSKIALHPSGRVHFEFLLRPEDDVSVDAALSRTQQLLRGLAQNGLPPDSIARVQKRALKKSKLQVRKYTAYGTVIALKGIQEIGNPLAVETYQQALAKVQPADLQRVLQSVTSSSFATTAIARSGASQ